LSAQEGQPVRLILNRAGADGLVGAPAMENQTRLFGALNNAWYGPAALTLADGRLFSFPSAFAWMEAAPADFIPPVSLAAPPPLTPAAPLARNPTRTPVDLLPRVDYIGGEVGGYYGRSTGKNGLEVKGGYIQSEIIQGNTYINFGASYEESSGRLPRFGR
jgi:hypothetical protein